ncbi:MAG: hypothetical protein Q8O53_03115 [Candidatus Moranbacteria bacterium]|nr:hypothetical protein [Candidatus Moranbacteria bacterium]
MSGFEAINGDNPKPGTFAEEAAARRQQQAVAKRAESERGDMRKAEGLWRAGVAGEEKYEVDLDKLAKSRFRGATFVSEEIRAPQSTETPSRLNEQALASMHVQADIIALQKFVQMATPELPLRQERINALNKVIKTLGDDDRILPKMTAELEKHKAFVKGFWEKKGRLERMEDGFDIDFPKLRH